MSLIPFYKADSLNEAFQSEILKKIANSEVLEPHETLSPYGGPVKTITFKDLKNKFSDSEHRRRRSFGNVMSRMVDWGKVTDDDLEGPLSAKEAFALLKSSSYPGKYYGFWFVDDEWAAFSKGNTFDKIFKKEYTINYEDFKKLIKDGITSKEEIDENGKNYWTSLNIPKGYYDYRRVLASVVKRTYAVNPVRIKEFGLNNAQVYLLDTSKFPSTTIRNRRIEIRKDSETYTSKSDRNERYREIAFDNQSRRRQILEKRKSESYKDPNRKVMEYLGTKYVEWLESLNLGDKNISERIYSFKSIASDIKSIFHDYKDLYNELYRMKEGYSYEGLDGLKKREEKLLQRIVKAVVFFDKEEKKRIEQEEK